MALDIINNPKADKERLDYEKYGKVVYNDAPILYAVPDNDITIVYGNTATTYTTTANNTYYTATYTTTGR